MTRELRDMSDLKSAHITLSKEGVVQNVLIFKRAAFVSDDEKLADGCKGIAWARHVSMKAQYNSGPEPDRSIAMPEMCTKHHEPGDFTWWLYWIANPGDSTGNSCDCFVISKDRLSDDAARKLAGFVLPLPKPRVVEWVDFGRQGLFLLEDQTSKVEEPTSTERSKVHGKE